MKNMVKLNFRIFFLLLAAAGMGRLRSEQPLPTTTKTELAKRLVSELGAIKEILPSVTPLYPQANQPSWLTDKEHADFNEIMNVLQTYTTKVYGCVDSFLSKGNNDPYRTHVTCFKNQLRFLRNALQQYPQAQTEQGTKLFNALKEIANALEKSQDMMCQTLDQEYKGIPLFKAKALGDELNKLTQPVNRLRANIDRQIGVLRNELRKAHALDMLNCLNKIYTLINKTFDYGNKKSQIELGIILMNRFKR